MILSVEIQAIEPLADGAAFGAVGAYERVIGVAKGEVDPGAPGNKGIALIDKAPRNARGTGRVHDGFLRAATQGPCERQRPPSL